MPDVAFIDESAAIYEQMRGLQVASGQSFTINGFRIERPHVGYWAAAPDPVPGGCGVYPPEYLAAIIAEHPQTV
jgi:hypothetical protein